jgi:flagellar biogenesis protein FliO
MKRLLFLIFIITFTSQLGAIDPNSERVLDGAGKAEEYTQMIKETSEREVSFVPIVLVYILLGSGVLWVGWRYVRNNGMLPGKDLKSNESTQVRILGSKPLGNKERLLVVEFENRRLLLGVGPNFISYLTDVHATTQKAPPKFEIKEEQESSPKTEL